MLVARCVCNISWAVTRVNTDILPAGVTPLVCAHHTDNSTVQYSTVQYSTDILPAGVTPLVCSHHTDNSGALLSTHYRTLRLTQNLLFLPLLSVLSIFPNFLGGFWYPKQDLGLC